MVHGQHSNVASDRVEFDIRIDAVNFEPSSSPKQTSSHNRKC